MCEKGLNVMRFFFKKLKKWERIRIAIIKKHNSFKGYEAIAANLPCFKICKTVKALPRREAKKKLNERSALRLMRIVEKTPHKMSKEQQVYLEQSGEVVSDHNLHHTLNQVGSMSEGQGGNHYWKKDTETQD